MTWMHGVVACLHYNTHLYSTRSLLLQGHHVLAGAAAGGPCGMLALR
jgi:hypothetical protein